MNGLKNLLPKTKTLLTPLFLLLLTAGPALAQTAANTNQTMGPLPEVGFWEKLLIFFYTLLLTLAGG